MSGKGSIRGGACGLLLATSLLLPAAAGAQSADPGAGTDVAAPAEAAPAAAHPMTIEVKGPKRPGVLRKLRVVGELAEPGPGKSVFIKVRASGRQLFVRELDPHDVTGGFQTVFQVRSCCNYTVRAFNGGGQSNIERFSVRVPKHLSPGPKTRLFNRLLQREGYHLQGISHRLNWASRLAILAFRKVNGMSRKTAYKRSIFRKLLQGRGGFKPKKNRKGRYVEVDISRQVMALIVGGEPRHVFHVSTGAGSTPTVRGKYHFYMRQPGYNSSSMYYSVYFYGGYATHGYDPVPTYNASHGCVRNPIPYSKFIYNWVSLGMPIWVYN